MMIFYLRRQNVHLKRPFDINLILFLRMFLKGQHCLSLVHGWRLHIPNIMMYCKYPMDLSQCQKKRFGIPSPSSFLILHFLKTSTNHTRPSTPTTSLAVGWPANPMRHDLGSRDGDLKITSDFMGMFKRYVHDMSKNQGPFRMKYLKIRKMLRKHEIKHSEGLMFGGCFSFFEKFPIPFVDLNSIQHGKKPWDLKEVE